MKLKFILVISLLFASLTFAQLDRSQRPEAGPAPEINFGELESFTLDNGLKVFIVENDKLPKVTLKLLIDRDPILEGKNIGYVSIAGDMLRTGTESKTKDQLDEEIDFIGANINTSSQSVTGSALSKHTEKLFELFSDIVLNANFTQEELDKLKKQYISGIQSEKDDPNASAAKLRKALTFGQDHPYGETMTEETVKSVDLQMAEEYYEKYFAPNISYLAIVGDIEFDEAKDLVQNYFGEWERKEVPENNFQTPEPPSSMEIALVDRPVSVQSVVNLAYPVVLPKGSDDIFAAGVLNTILGGGFSSRLNMNLREDKAFTYGVRSRLASDEVIGSFTVSTEVRNSATDSTVVEIIKEMQGLKTGEVKDDELDLAKNFLMGNFSRSLERPETIADFAINIERYDLPEDYYKNYLKNLEAVSKEDVSSTAQKYLKPENSYVVVVGNAEEVADNLKNLSPTGEVKYYDIDANEYDPTAQNIPEDVTLNSVVDDYIRALGGREKLENVNDLKIEMSGNVQGMDVKLNVFQKKPGMLYQNLDAGAFQQTTIYNGEKAIQKGMGQTQEITGAALDALKLQAVIFPALNYDELGVQPELTGMETIDSVDAYRLSLTLPNGNKSMNYYDAENGLMIRQVIPMETPQGVVNQTIDYQNYQEVDGIKFPFTIIQQIGPQRFEMTTQSVEVNPGLEDSQFSIE